MTNNDIMRRIRYTFDFDDNKMMSLFEEAGHPASRAQVSSWLKKEGERGSEEPTDVVLAIFLNGMIIDFRGRQDGPLPEPEHTLSYNIVFRKLKIALNLQAEEILRMLSDVGITLSKHELSAFFRKPDHKHYRDCKGQVMRKFIHAIQAKYRDNVYDEGYGPENDEA